VREVALDAFFFPLDSIHNWNRIYGREGFIQYQLVLPQDSGEQGLQRILERIANSPHGSFLAVLKHFGAGNSNLLSFPMAGYTLALDFKRTPGLEPLLAQLDQLVMEYGGRLYLAKDARMSQAMFRATYPQWQEFAELRSRYGADRLIHSLQSKRLGL
jgi:decaprenylphospho-beta-D-ribofuranose 2-oxidase